MDIMTQELKRAEERAQKFKDQADQLNSEKRQFRSEN
jgi:hypothetical protein